MAEDQNGWLHDTLARTDLAVRLFQAVLGLSGVIVLVFNAAGENPYLFSIAIAGVVIAAFWTIAGYYLRRRRPRPLTLPAAQRQSTYLRSLLPFEEQDVLLGRDQEIGQLLTRVRNLEFRFGFLSGEAGAGKTSILRAGLVPGLKKDANWLPVYVPRTRGEPDAALRRELLAVRVLSATDPVPEDLGTLLSKVAAAAGKTVFVIFDQFEEFFVIQSTAEARSAFASTLAAVSAGMNSGLPVRVLFALRKEFVDDLLDFSGVVPELQHSQWRQPLRNFPSATALAILQKIVVDDNLTFSEDLQTLVIRDLAHDERVRPVEFQLVLTRLLEQGIVDVTRYRDLGGAQGVLSHFIAELIEPADLKIDAVDKLVARHTLRALCGKEFTTRRPVGLTQVELSARLEAELRATGPPTTALEIDAALRRIVQRLMQGYVLIQEDEERFNIVHDYLASPIRDATADIETTEERANRLLASYLDQNRVDRGVFIPWGKLAFLRKFASREQLSSTRATTLVNRSWWRHMLGAGGIAAVTLIVATLLLPYGIHYPIREQAPLSGRSIVSRNGRLLADVSPDGSTFVKLYGAKFEVWRSTQPLADVVVSPDGQYVLALGTDGALYDGHEAGGFTLKAILDDMGWSGEPRRILGQWGVISDDSSWAAVVRDDGRMFAWPVGSRPRLVTRLKWLHDRFFRPVPSFRSQQANAKESRSAEPPRFGFLNTTSRLFVVDGRGNIYFQNTLGKAGRLPSPVMSSEGSHETQIVLSANKRWFVVSDQEHGVRAVEIGKDADAKVVALLPISRVVDNSPAAPAVWVSPDEQWLIARAAFANFYVVPLSNMAPEAAFPAIELPHSSSDSFPPVVFGEDGYVAGFAQDRKLYLWQLEKPPRRNAKPAFESADAEEDDFERRNPRAWFCKNARTLLLSVPSGKVLARPYGSADSDVRELTSGLVRVVSQFESAEDEIHVFATEGPRLAFGVCGEPLETLSVPSTILRLSDDGEGHLLVVGRNEVSRIGRTFYLWGLPIWRLEWPRPATPVANPSDT